MQPIALSLTEASEEKERDRNHAQSRACQQACVRRVWLPVCVCMPLVHYAVTTELVGQFDLILKVHELLHAQHMTQLQDVPWTNPVDLSAPTADQLLKGPPTEQFAVPTEDSSGTGGFHMDTEKGATMFCAFATPGGDAVRIPARHPAIRVVYVPNPD